MSKHGADLLLFFLVGLAIGLALRERAKKPDGTPPQGAKTQRLHDTGELEEIRRKLKVG